MLKMLLTEFRIPMPFTLEEFQRGQIYTTMKTSEKESEVRGEGIEVLRNEPFQNNPELPASYSSGQYTSKVYNFVNRFPFFIRALAPKSAMLLNEDSWNSYPFCRTVLSNPRMKEDFVIKIDSIHFEGHSIEENAHKLSPELLAIRSVVNIDIASESLPNNWRKDSRSPSGFVSDKSGRGPLTGNWTESCEPFMMCYKLVQVKFRWFGIQKKVENFIMKTERRVFTSFHRNMFVWTDEWFDMTLAQLRRLEQLSDDRHAPYRHMSRYQTSTYAIHQ